MKNPMARFWSKVRVAGDSSCWPWKSAINSSGYGTFNLNGVTQAAHRLAWEYEHGAIPDGSVLRHLCHNKACVNPAHLATGTQKENIEDNVRDGKILRGSQIGTATLTEVQVQEIKAALKVRHRNGKMLAEQYGVWSGTIAAINTGRRWKHVEPTQAQIDAELKAWPEKLRKRYPWNEDPTKHPSRQT